MNNARDLVRSIKLASARLTNNTYGLVGAQRDTAASILWCGRRNRVKALARHYRSGHWPI